MDTCDNSENELSGYIYVRSNELCQLYNCYKLGRTHNIPDRENKYYI